MINSSAEIATSASTDLTCAMALETVGMDSMKCIAVCLFGVDAISISMNSVYNFSAAKDTCGGIDQLYPAAERCNGRVFCTSGEDEKGCGKQALTVHRASTFK